MSRPMQKHIAISLLVPLLLVAPKLVSAENVDAKIPSSARCQPIYGVQKHGCVLEKFYRCDHEGRETILAESYGEIGLYYIDFTDLSGNTILSWSRDSLSDVVALVDLRDALSFDDLQRDGMDSFDITHLVTHEWFADPIQSRFTADLRLTGETLEVDGVVFHQTELVGQSTRNAFVTSIYRHYYIDFDFGTFPWGGTEDEREDFGESAFVPKQVIFPDNPEFQRNDPQYGCGTLSQSIPNLLRQVRG